MAEHRDIKPKRRHPDTDRFEQELDPAYWERLLRGAGEGVETKDR